MAEPEDLGDDEGVPTELVELYEVLEWENAVADSEGRELPHPQMGVPPPPDPGVRHSSPFVSKAAAGLRPATCISNNFRLEGLTIHYSGPSPWTSVDRSSSERFQATALHSRCASIWRSFQAFHMDDRGGCDIFYHGAACPHGTRFEGRSGRSGAQGTDDGNFRSFGIQTLMGDGDPLTDASKAAFLDEEQRLGAPFRWGHRDWKSTSCPGGPAYEWRLAGFPPPTTQEDDMTPEDHARIATVVRDDIRRLGQYLALGVANQAFPGDLYGAGVTNPKLMAAVQQIEGVDVDEAAIAAGILAGLNPVEIGQAVVAAIGPELAKDVIEALAAELAD
ncbi:MAG: hypothetical protein ACRD0W_03755 [Acidimicrobiales bacterium]